MNTQADIRKESVEAVLRRAVLLEEELHTYPPRIISSSDVLVDSLVVHSAQNPTPDEVFDRLRWGGHLVYMTTDHHDAVRASIRLGNFGFDIVHPPTSISENRWRIPIPLFQRKTFFFIARKVQLIQVGQTTERFTYYVHLGHDRPTDPYVVVKEVPTLDMLMARLRSKWPELTDQIVEKRARKFYDKIFPVFLTREAAILKIVQRDLPEEYRHRVPRLLAMEQDERGYVRKMCLSWLRNGGKPLTHLEFARQSADLLRALHDQVGVMHLDLRLDNFVITPGGVGFVDFGSAVRMDEDLKENPLLSNLFEELMRTSEIQRMLLRMTRTGQVTSEAISCGLHKVDKAVDYFYLAVQISAPHANPDLKDLIQYDEKSEEAQLLSELTNKILRPADPAKPTFCSAADILSGIDEIQRVLTPSEPMPAALERFSEKIEGSAT